MKKVFWCIANFGGISAIKSAVINLNHAARENRVVAVEQRLEKVEKLLDECAVILADKAADELNDDDDNGQIDN